MRASWIPFLRQALQGSRGFLALLDLSGAVPALQGIPPSEVQRFLQMVARRLAAWLPEGSQGFLLGGPLLGLLSPQPPDGPPEAWLARLHHRWNQAHFTWQNTLIRLQGRLVALPLRALPAPEVLIPQLLEHLYSLPEDTWHWLAGLPEPNPWQRFWEPWLGSWARALGRRATVLWITGGSALDRDLVLDILLQNWARLGFPLLRACLERARFHPYGALLDALAHFDALRGTADGTPGTDFLGFQTMTEARRWLTEAVASRCASQPLLLLVPEFQAWPPESRHVLKHLIQEPENFSVVVTSAHLPEPALRSKVSLQKLPDLRESLSPSVLGALFPGLDLSRVLAWFLQKPSTHRLHCLWVLYTLRGPETLENLKENTNPAEEILAALPADERRFLRKISLLEGALDSEVVEALTGFAPVKATALMHRLAVRRLLRSDGLGTFYLPSTPLRRYLLGTLKQEHRLELHRRVLRVLASRDDPAGRAQRIGHLLAVGQYEQALQDLLEEAQGLFRQGAPISALQRLRQAVRLARSDPALVETLRTHLNLQGWLPPVNSVEALPTLLREALSLAEDLQGIDDPQNRFALLRWSSRLLCHLGRYEEAWNLGQELHRQAGLLRLPEYTAQALESLGLTAWYRDEVGRALDLWKQALVHAQESGDPRLLARILGNLGMVYQRQHQYALALRHYVGALRIYNRLGHRESVGIGLGMIGNVFRAWGNMGRALHYYRRAAHVCQQVGDPYNAVVWKAEEGFVYTDLALWEEGIPRLLEALTLARSLEAFYLLANLQVEILWVQARRGYATRALEGFTRLIRKLEARGVNDLEMRARLYRVELLIRQGQLEEARRLLHHLEQEHLGRNLPFRDAVDLLWIRYLNARGRHREALQRFPHWFQDLEGPIPSGTARLQLDALRAETLVFAQDPRARTYLQQAWRHVQTLARSLSSPDQARRFLNRQPEVQTLRALRQQVHRLG